jgi:formiminoglutamase
MSSKFNQLSLDIYAKSDLQNFCAPRAGENKIGDAILNWESKGWRDAKFVILGVEESLGPRANLGRGGAENAFKAFLSKFLGMQSNTYFEAKNVGLLGCVKVDAEVPVSSDVVESLDGFILETLSTYLTKGQIPILIGGGHNNALPLINYLSQVNEQMVNVVNLDAHADYRLLEGRHSGNAFSYAFDMGWLSHYHVFGLHYQYNSQQIFEDLKRDGHSFTLFEDYIADDITFERDLKKYLSELEKQKPLGIELDLDAIAQMPSSAFSPLGFSIKSALFYLRSLATHQKVGYLHLTEGAPCNEQEEIMVGKTLAYFVTDFIRANLGNTNGLN